MTAADWDGTEERRRPGSRTPINAADIADLQRAVETLTARMPEVTEALKEFSPKHEVDETIRAEVEGLRLEVGDAIGDANAASEISLGIIRRLRDEQNRRLAKARQALRIYIASMTSAVSFAVVLASVLTELHFHRGHLAQIEHVNNAILARGETGLTVDYGSGVLPLFPPGNAGHWYEAVGPWVYIIFGTIWLASGIYALVQRRDYLSDGGVERDPLPEQQELA